MKYFDEIDEGCYTTVDEDGNYWTFRIKAAPKMDNQLVVSLFVDEEGHKWHSFAFLLESFNAGPYLAIWKRVVNGQDRYRYDEDWYRQRVAPILNNPQECSSLFAKQTCRCSRCGRPLRVPASLHAGRGPECAGKGKWAKSDHVAAFLAEEAKLTGSSEPRDDDDIFTATPISEPRRGL